MNKLSIRSSGARVLQFSTCGIVGLSQSVKTQNSGTNPKREKNLEESCWEKKLMKINLSRKIVFDVLSVDEEKPDNFDGSCVGLV